MTPEEREMAARWRREEQIQLVQHDLWRSFLNLLASYRDLDARYTKLVNECDELREAHQWGPSPGLFW